MIIPPGAKNAKEFNRDSPDEVTPRTTAGLAYSEDERPHSSFSSFRAVSVRFPAAWYYPKVPASQDPYRKLHGNGIRHVNDESENLLMLMDSYGMTAGGVIAYPHHHALMMGGNLEKAPTEYEEITYWLWGPMLRPY